MAAGSGHPRDRDWRQRRRRDDRSACRRRIRLESRRGGVHDQEQGHLRGRAAHRTLGAGGRGAHRRRAEERMTGLNGDREAVQALVDGALASLEANRGRIDDLNVYPVPDGDTGTNLTMTMRAVKEAVDSTSAAGRQSLARDVARGALMGARGNSGVIFSQIVRGAADVLGETDAPTLDADALARALRGAADAAYRAVRKPVEGTMLTVIRELAEEAEAQATADLPVGDLLRALVRRGEDALARTPQYLKVLREAGVVDAGGAGLLELVRGLASAITGEELPELPAELEAVGFDAVHQELSRYRYCTVFVVEGERLEAARLERELEELG